MTTYNGISAKKIILFIKDVHGTAATTTAAFLFSIHLCHYFSRIYSACQGMGVFPVGSQDIIFDLEGLYHAGRYRFFAYIKMEKTPYLFLGIQLGTLLFKLSH